VIRHKQLSSGAEVLVSRFFTMRVGGFIVGFDNDSPTIFQQQIVFIQKSGIVTAMVGLLQAPTGTSRFDRMQKEGRLIDDYSGDNVDGSTNIVPKMGIETLKEGYRMILGQIYAPKFYTNRVLTFLRDYQAPKIRFQFAPQCFMALWRMVYRLGIHGAVRLP
jgi:hypothetical protein